MAAVVTKLSPPLTLGEGPHWDADRQCLFYVDILGHSIHKYDPASDKHYKTKLGGRVGFITPVAGSADEFVVGLESAAVVVRWDGAEGSPAAPQRTLAALDTHPRTRVNDGKVDPAGRLFAGTMGAPQEDGGYSHEGALYRVEPRATSCTRVLSGLGIANGLAWNPARRAFYYIDSNDKAVRKYRYDVTTGDISDKTIFFDLPSNDVDGLPDGMTIDSDGNLWIAVFNGSKVIQVCGESGELLRAVALPTPQVTSLAWGGAALDQLYVTTADVGAGARGDGAAGCLYRVTGLGATGLPMLGYALR